MSNIDIFGISEHFICHQDIDNFSFPNYTTITYFSRNLHIHGGTLIMAKTSLHCKQVDAIKSLSEECHIEMCAVSFCLNENKTILIVVYRPPSGDIHMFFNLLTQALLLANKLSKWIILCGDFNIDLNKQCSNTNFLCDILSSFELAILNSEPTRVFTNIHGYTSSTCIDYMVTNIPRDFVKCDISNPNIADHLAHMLCVKIGNIKNNGSQKIFYKKRNSTENNINYFKTKLSQIQWRPLYDHNLSINKLFKYFLDTILWYFNITCPIKEYSKNVKGQIRI